METEPAAIMLDKMPRPEDVVAKGSIFWDVLKKTYEVGYQRMAFPQLVGGKLRETSTYPTCDRPNTGGGGRGNDGSE